MTQKKFQFALMALVTMPIISVAILAATGALVEKQLPVYGEVPPFSLTERTGETVSNETLNQKVWVASFVFTHCAGQCPLIIEEVKKIQKALRFKERFRLVSITVDPKRDSTQVLAEYANKVNADPYKWLFLTGKEAEIQALVQNGFRLSAADEGADAGGDVTHSGKLVLVDGFGKIRGYYDANESGEVRKLIKDAKKLIKKAF